MTAVPTVQQALAAVARDVGVVPKGGKADERSGGYRYRGIDDVINALHGPLVEHGVVICPQVVHWATHEYHGYKSGVWSLTQVQVRYMVYGPAGDHVEVVGIGEGIDNGDKGPGKAMSYAWKTAISQLFSLPTDDPEMDNETAPPPDADARRPTGRSRRASAPPPDPVDDDPALRARMLAAVAALDQDGQDEAASWLRSERRSLKNPVEVDTLTRFGDYMAAWLDVPAWPAPQQEDPT